MPSKKKSATLIGLAALATLSLAGVSAVAEQRDDAQELQRLESSRMSLAEAIQVAEKQFNGKAVSASLDMKQATTTFVVEIMSAKGSQSVAVDTETGKLAIVQMKDGENENGAEDAD